MLVDFLNLAERVDVFYVISQIFATVAIVLDLIAIQKKEKIKLLKFYTIGAICSVFSYLFLAAWPGMITRIINTARNSIAMYETKKHKTSKLVPVIFVTIYMLGGILSYESPISLFPAISASIATISLYLLSASNIRKVAIFTASLWLIYDIYVFSIVGIISAIIFIINGLLAVYRYRKKK